MRVTVLLSVALTTLTAGCPLEPACPDGFTPGGAELCSRVVPGPVMVEARECHTATTLLDGRVLVVGGRYSANSAELFDPATLSFVSAAPPLHPRVDHGAVLLPDGRVLISGGNLGDDATTRTELYDPATDAWIEGPQHIGNNMFKPSLVAASSGRVIAVDGKDVEVLEPGADAWVEGPPMPAPSPRSDWQLCLLADGRAAFVGGRTPEVNEPHLSNVDILDAETLVWSAAPPLNIGRDFHTATVLEDGDILVTGGRRAPYDEVAEPEWYRVADDAWSLGPPVPTTRHTSAARLVTDEVLRVGPSRDVDLLRLSAEGIMRVALAPLDIERTDPTIVALDSGDALIAGGNVAVQYRDPPTTEIVEIINTLR